MSINKIDTSVVINGNTYPVEQYGLNITSPEPIDGDISGDIFGCDYATVIVTTDRSVVDTLLSMIDESVFNILTNEFNQTIVRVVKVNNAYVIDLEIDVMPENIYDYVSDNMVVFGAYADDVPIDQCVKGYQYCIGHNDIEQVYEDFMDTMDEDDEDQEELECSLDSYTRILNFTDNRQRVDDVLTEFVNV